MNSWWMNNEIGSTFSWFATYQSSTIRPPAIWSEQAGRLKITGDRGSLQRSSNDVIHDVKDTACWNDSTIHVLRRHIHVHRLHSWNTYEVYTMEHRDEDRLLLSVHHCSTVNPGPLWGEHWPMHQILDMMQPKGKQQLDHQEPDYVKTRTEQDTNKTMASQSSPLCMCPSNA